LTTATVPILPAVAVALSAAVWGTYWIPLRAAEATGLGPSWVTFAFYAVPAAALAPLAAARWRRFAAAGPSLAVTGAAAGGAFALYANALLETEVVRALLLFYATPLWSTLLARWQLAEPITGRRLAGLALGVTGLLVILGADPGLPMLRNAGDWMGLGSGLAWAFAAVRLRADRAHATAEVALACFGFAALTAAALALALHGGLGAPAAWGALAGEWWFPAFTLAVLLPSTVLILWGSGHLSPGLVGILFMSEVSVGTISAALLAGEPFGVREAAGVALVTSAGVIELVPGRLRVSR
jgi:drug/metabolite transporter (DMT)-like permease